jgi:hypothetical protein
MMILLQSSFHATRASLFEMDVKPSSLDRNGNELEHEQELEFKKHGQLFGIFLKKALMICPVSMQQM